MFVIAKEEFAIYGQNDTIHVGNHVVDVNLFSNGTAESEPGSTTAKSRQADGRGCEDKTGNGRRAKRQEETVGSYCGHIVTGLDFQGDDGRIISRRFGDFLDWIACP